MFKKGDKVVCVGASYTTLEEGKEYIVEGTIDDDGGDDYFVVLEGNCTDYEFEDRGWYASRFKLVQE